MPVWKPVGVQQEVLHGSRRSASDAGDDLFYELPGIDYPGLAPALGKAPLVVRNRVIVRRPDSVS